MSKFKSGIVTAIAPLKTMIILSYITSLTYNLI